MEATHAWCGLIERMPTSKREFWFTLIRVIIVVALIGSAARLAAIAYAPPTSAMSQQLICPPDVVTYREIVVSPQVLGVTEQSASSVTNDDGLANKSELRSMTGKEAEHRSGAKKPPTYTFARNGVLLKRAAMGELAKRSGIDMDKQQKRKTPVPMLAHSAIYPSPFDDLHGQ
jgi:hypothetical protein